MTNKVNIATLCFTFILLLSSCQEKKAEIMDEVTTDSKMENKETQEMESDSLLVHTVFFWFNEGVTTEQRTMFEAELGKLAKCETIDKVWYGKPAMTPRDVVDNSYDYAWICHFKNKADQDVYQEDPIHLAFIEACKEYWKKVQVYDSMVKEL